MSMLEKIRVSDEVQQELALSKEAFVKFRDGRSRPLSAFILYLAGQILFGMTFLLIGMYLMNQHNQDDFVLWLVDSSGMQVLMIPWTVLSMIVLWRCAVNARRRFWFYVSRLYVMLVALGYIDIIYNLAVVNR